MKLPAPRGGVSEEGELSVLMELLINPSLLIDVVPYCGLHHMIQQHRYIMALMDILAHASILRPKGRGINPGVIKRRYQQKCWDLFS